MITYAWTYPEKPTWKAGDFYYVGNLKLVCIGVEYRTGFDCGPWWALFKRETVDRRYRP